MPTQHADLFAALGAPFQPNEVKVRSQAGRQLHYITARTAMNRLDDVLGPENWWDSYQPLENSVLCRLTIRYSDPDQDGKWVTLTKEDAGGYAGMADSGDDDKSGYSDAFKRACVKFCVGRYLYRDGVPGFVRELAGGEQMLPAPTGNPDYDGEPARQAPQRPQGGGNGAPRGNGQGGGTGQHSGPPRSGRALFAYLRNQEEATGLQLVKFANQYAKLQDFPARLVDCDADQALAIYEEVRRKVAAHQGVES